MMKLNNNINISYKINSDYDMMLISPNGTINLYAASFEMIISMLTQIDCYLRLPQTLQILAVNR